MARKLIFKNINFQKSKMSIDPALPIYTISSAAKILNISVHTVRMYEREGLLIPFKKQSGHRLFSENDLEHIRCIRKAIKEQKLSIEGIKRILSLIPCWGVIHCPVDERENCDAYNSHGTPCWTLRHTNDYCQDKNCYTCDVYRKSSNCDIIKEMLKKLIVS